MHPFFRPTSGLPTVLLFAVAFLVGTLVAADNPVDITKAFIVLTDKDHGGSCDPYNVGPLLQEVVDMNNAAIAAIDIALQNPVMMPVGDKIKDRKRILNMLKQMFGIQFSSNRFLVKVSGDRVTLGEVKAKYQRLNIFSQVDSKVNNGKIRLACHDKWAHPITQTIPGDPKGVIPIKDVAAFNNQEFVFWDQDWPRYQPSGGYIDPSKFNPPWNSQGFCDQFPHRMGVSIGTHEIITICPNSFGTFPATANAPARQLVQLLRPYADGTIGIPTDGTKFLDGFMSVSGVLLHEMTHMILGTNDNIGYDFAKCQAGAAVGYQNADTFVLFAEAMWMNQYDWHTGTCLKPK